MRSQRRISTTVNNFVIHRLREARVGKGLKALEVARRAGIPNGSFGCLENGWHRLSLDNLFRILQVLGLKVQDVWPAGDGRPAGPVDGEYIERSVHEALRRLPRPAGLDDFFEAVSRAFDVPKDKLLSPSRWVRLQEARAVCGLLAEEAGVQLKPLCSSLRVSIPAMVSLIRQHRARAETDSEFASRLEAARQWVSESTGSPLNAAAR